MSDTSKATPRPWHWEFEAIEHGYEKLVGRNGFAILVHSEEDGDIKEHDKSLIIQAVNSYNPERARNAMLALEDLTPGGSEYVGDVTCCVEFIRQRQSTQHERIVSLTKQLRASAGNTV